jgi:uncharacterized protein involved in response to NO
MGARPAPAQDRLSVPSALLNLGFRPFYLLAALFAALAVPAWVAELSGHGWPAGYLEGLLWHQHEMVFGFALAVIAGFLLTAGRLWTGLPTPSGAPLALLAGHWIAARVLVITGPGWLGALADGAFPFVVAAVLGRIVFRARNLRNYFVPLLLAALGLVNACFHLSALGLIEAPASLSAQGGLYLVVLLLIVMAGRVVPSFTASALPQARLRRSAALDYAALAISALAFAGALAELDGWLGALPAFVAAALHAARQAGWAPLATRGRPILWILHLSHAWIPVGFVLLGLALLGLVIGAAPLHAFAVGALSGTIIGMITRTALGHTGRPLAAGRAEVAAYVLVHCAAAARVAAALVLTAYMPLVYVSATLWSAAFLTYFIAYAPRLARPRLDGRPG